MGLRLRYAKHFFTGKKSQQMIRIERENPILDGFDRCGSFFHAFGNIGFGGGKRWCIILPARHSVGIENNKDVLFINLGIISIYWGKWKNDL